jgi:hypothetical protein
MQNRSGLSLVRPLVAWLLCSTAGCSLFDPPEVRLAKAMNQQMDAMQRFVQEIDKGMKEREQREREQGK